MTNNYVFTTQGDVIKKIEIDSGDIIDTLVIPEGFTKIEADAAIYVNIRKLHLPSSLKEIEDNAFASCGIKEIHGGENVEIIGVGAFASNSLKSVTDFKNLTMIDEDAFEGSIIEEFYFPKTLKTIRSQAFMNNNLKFVDLSNLENVTIETRAFALNNIEELKLPEESSIYCNAFAFNRFEEKDVLNIEGASYVKKGINYPFNHSYKTPPTDLSYEVKKNDLWDIDDFYIGGENDDTIIGFTDKGLEKLQNSFNRVDGVITNNYSIVFPKLEGVTKIGSKIFGNKYHSTDIYIEDGYTDILKEAFRVSSVEHIRLPQSLRRIGNSAFECSELQEIRAHENLTTIEAGAFRATSIKYVDLSESNVKVLRGNTFYSCTELRTIKLPKKLTKIGQGAFISTYSLREIEFPKTLREVSRSSFSGSGIDKISIEENSKLELIEPYAFLGCKNLTEFPFKDLKNLKHIGFSAFESSGLKSLYIDNRDIDIQAFAFRYSSIEDISLNIKIYPTEAFTKIRAKKIKIKGAEKIESKAFVYADVDNVELKDVKELDLTAFSGCPVEELNIPDDTKLI